MDHGQFDFLLPKISRLEGPKNLIQGRWIEMVREGWGLTEAGRQDRVEEGAKQYAFPADTHSSNPTLKKCVPQCCRVSLVIEMFVRMLHHCGMPVDDVDLIHGNGKVVGEILQKANVRSTLFTGSAKVAETLAVQLRGKVVQSCPLNLMYEVISSESCVCSHVL